MSVTRVSSLRGSQRLVPVLFLLGIVPQVISAAVILPVLSRMVAAGAVGTISVAAVSAQVLALVLHLGSPLGLARGFFLDDSKAVTNFTARMQTGLLSAVSAVTAGVAITCFAFDLNGLLIWLSTAALGLLWSACLVDQAMARVWRKPFRFAAFGALPTLTVPAVGVVGVVADASANMFFFAQSVGVVVVGSLLAGTSYKAARRGGQSRSKARAFAKWCVRISLPTVPHIICLFLIGGLVRYLGAFVGGPELAAHAQVAYVVGGFCLSILGAMNNFWSIQIYSLPTHEVPAYLRRSLTAMLFLSLTCVVVAVLAGPVLIRFAAGSLIVGNDTYFAAAIIAVAALPLPFYLANVTLLVTEERTRSLAVITPLVTIGSAALGLVLGKTFGLVGVALLMPIAYIALALATGLQRRRYSAVKFLMWNHYLYLGGAAAILFLPIALDASHLTQQVFVLVGVVSAGVVLIRVARVLTE